MKLHLYLASAALSLGSACVTPQQHARGVQADPHDRLSPGTVQREIKKGISGAEVAETLGSPNIVTTDAEGREVWIYDKISRDSVRSSSSGLGAGLLVGGSGGAGGLGSLASGASSTSQRTLTVVIKFDADGRVRDLAYHASRF